MQNSKVIIAGVDEAGRGPLVGPVYAAAVILDENIHIDGIRDSKKLSAKKRESLFEIICMNAKSYGISYSTVEEIDKLNILQASLLAMKRAVEKLSIVPEHVLIDGNKAPDLKVKIIETVVKGDSKFPVISAASILAKVARDAKMEELDKLYPEYEFSKHKGYPTKRHLEILEKYGPIEGLYRTSYKPVQKYIIKDCVV